MFTPGYGATYRVDYKIIERKAVEFDVTDSKGRQVGYAVTISREFVRQDDNVNTGYPAYRIGEFFEVRPQAQRDGRAFGAIPVRSLRFVRTLDEARAIRAEMFAKAEKAAKKKFSS